MDLTTGFLVYATLYRLAIVAAGALAILLGYRLFLHGTIPEKMAGTLGTQASVEGGGFKFSIGNAAPGTCFAVFGAALIVAMVIQGNPELISNRGGVSTATDGTDEIRIKGLTATTPETADTLRSADSLIGQKNTSAELDSYRQILSSPAASAGDVADAAMGITHIYLAQDRPLEALTLARLAVQIDAADPHKLDALAAAARASNQPKESAAAEARAAALRNAVR